jgi:hypothetical protein
MRTFAVAELELSSTLRWDTESGASCSNYASTRASSFEDDEVYELFGKMARSGNVSQKTWTG